MTEKYRKRPIVVEAQQLTDENMAKVAKWCGGHVATTGRMRVSTLVGEMWCSPGSWIIKGVEGEFYPVQDSIFQATYEPVEEDAMRGMKAFHEHLIASALFHTEVYDRWAAQIAKLEPWQARSAVAAQLELGALSMTAAELWMALDIALEAVQDHTQACMMAKK